MNGTSYIYFIQVIPNGPIKIGTTTCNPHLRIKSIQTGCPWPVKLLGAIEGTSAQEKQIHAVLSYFRELGEWFSPHEAVLSAVKTALECGKLAPVLPRKNISYDSKIDHVIRSLGGPSAVAKLVGLKQPAVSNWKKRGILPAKTYIAIQSALAARRMTAPNSLWGMPESGMPS